MVIPMAQRRLMLAALHEGHPGIAAMRSKVPAELFLGCCLPTWLDHLKPDPRNKMEIEVWKQKVYHDANVRARSFRQGDEIWVKNECKPG
ncbi:hypothetical protein J437_LFUL008901 [Ladona fulva]|uniref:Uncharacterized protein n=1 Tax=Ladona fulva TaxID=123851 RepID=A0A8K0P2G9_LADFU|nr:hypothetical protein J437_LFUL008901 [Ladona fulva]